MLICNFANNQQEITEPYVNKQQDTEPEVEELDAEDEGFSESREQSSLTEVIQNTIR